MALLLAGLEPVNWFGDPTNALITITLPRCWQFGSAMVIFLAALQSIDKSPYEAAACDGAKPWHSFLFITIPLITPVIFFNLIMQMVQAFRDIRLDRVTVVSLDPRATAEPPLMADRIRPLRHAGIAAEQAEVWLDGQRLTTPLPLTEAPDAPA